jgi:hypothetical protein
MMMMMMMMIMVYYVFPQSAMVVGTLALMVHVWVCLMRFFQYYLDTLIRDVSTAAFPLKSQG